MLDIPFQWTGPNSLAARFKLARTGTYRTLVKMGGRNIVRGPAMTLPYSPEFMPRVGLPEGRQVLAAISELTGGRERLDVLEALSDRPRSARMTSLLPLLFAIAVVLLVLEIAGRRLSLWSKLTDVFEGAVPAEAALPRASVPRRRVGRSGSAGELASIASRQAAKPQGMRGGRVRVGNR